MIKHVVLQFPQSATVNERPTIKNLTPGPNAKIDGENPRKIIVYREEEFSVDVNLTDDRGRLDQIKVHKNAYNDVRHVISKLRMVLL